MIGHLHHDRRSVSGYSCPAHVLWKGAVKTGFVDAVLSGGQPSKKSGGQH